MLPQFKKQLREFRQVPPGKRFQEHYKRRRETGAKTATVWRVLNLVLAVVAMILGIVFSLIPGVPGFVFFFVAALLLAAESNAVARTLDTLDLKIRNGWNRLRRRAPGQRGARVRRVGVARP